MQEMDTNYQHPNNNMSKSDNSDALHTYSFTNNVNIPNEHGNVPLHTAIMQDDINMLKYLLNQPEIDVNYKSYKGETPLLMSLWRFRCDVFITHLIKAGCDPNSPNKYELTPLHLAMQRSSIDVAQQLIQRGADINAQDEYHRSALHHAVDNNNLEGVSMLLYYGVDVTLLCKDNMTAFMLALYLNREDIAEVLYNFCDDFSCADIDGYTALHLAAKARNPIALDLVKAGADVNCLTDYDDNPLVLSLDYKDAKLFKLIWPRIDYQALLNGYEPFLLIYTFLQPFSPSEYLECLYLILESPKACDLLEHLIECSSFKDLFRSLYYKNVELSDRTAIINICLSFGFKADINDINHAFKLYGFGEELEAFIYSFDNDYDSANLDSLLLHFILAVKDYSFAETNELLIKSFRNITFDKYFSISLRDKEFMEHLLKLDGVQNQENLLKLSSIPKFPSLLELSRNEAYRFVIQKYKIKRPYKFHDIVKNLKLPPYVQDILRFKTPIY